MRTLARAIDDILRGQVSIRSAGVAVACGLAYGAVMGSFAGRPAQAAVSAIKVPLLLAATLVLSLPSFFVLNTLLGVRADFPHALRSLIASQAGLTIVLVSLAPVTLFWYASSSDYPSAILFNALMFALASLGSQYHLRRSYRPLIAKAPKHRWLLRVWLVLYAFNGIQAGWLLRPFIGAADRPVEFLRPDAWSNAYVVVARMVWDILR